MKVLPILPSYAWVTDHPPAPVDDPEKVSALSYFLNSPAWIISETAWYFLMYYMCFTSTFQSYLAMPSLLRYEAYKGFEAADRQHVWVHSASKICYRELKKAKPETLRQKHRTWEGTVHLVLQAVKEEAQKKPKTHPLLLVFSDLLVLRWL